MDGTELMNHVMHRPCTCCGRIGVTLDGDGICNTCWDTAAEEASEAEAYAREKSADHVDGYDRDDLGESPDY